MNSRVQRRHHLLFLWPQVVSGIAALLLSPAAFAQSRSGFAYNGIAHVSWWFNEYSNFDQPTGPATDSRNALAATGANWAALLVTQYMATSTSNTIAPEASGQKTPTDASLIFAIQDFHSKGIKVMLKPHVDVLDGTWRGQIHPADTNAWFQSYTTFIVHYAQLAQQNGVEGLVLGTEYVTMSGSANRTAWVNVISAVRTVFTGVLTYAANATFATDEFTSVSFWDKLDVIGLDAYFDLTNHADPTLAELVASWSSNLNGENILADVKNFAAAQGKPVIFTEIGYKSVAGANTQPWNSGLGGSQDLTEQNNCYEAAFEVWSQQTSFMKGIFWWDWPAPAPAAGDTDYNPRSKPAATTLASWQGPANGADFTMSATPASQTIPQNTSGNYAISITPSGGFSASVNLSVGSLPSGVTATLSPTATTSASTLTISPSLSAPNGTFSVTITGIGGGRGHSTSVSFTITSGSGASFSLSPSPASLAINQNASGTSTITVMSSGGFSSSVALTVSGLPAGVTASFIPTSTTTTSALTLTASATTAPGSFNLTVTGTGGGQTHSTGLTLSVIAATSDFSLSASPSALTVNRGASGTSTIAITRTGGFSGAVMFAAGGLPSGVTASFAPSPATGNSTVLTLAASSTAAAGTVSVTVNGTSGSLSHATSLSLTVAAPDFSLLPNPSTITLTPGNSGTSTISITRTGGFTGSVTFGSVSGLPSGVTASFNPNPASGNSAVLTVTVPSGTAASTSSMTFTATGGSVSHTLTIGLTVSGGGGGDVTITPVVAANSLWFDEEDVKVSNASALTALSITIVVQQTGGISFSGQYNTVGGSITQAHSSASSTVSYTFSLNSGQMLSAGSYTFAAQASGNGTAHPTTGDTWTVTYTTGGTSTSQTGHF